MANSGASIAQSAIERKQKMKAESLAQVETPNGTDGKKYRNLIKKDICRVLEILINSQIMIFHTMFSCSRYQPHEIRKWISLR